MGKEITTKTHRSYNHRCQAKTFNWPGLLCRGSCSRGAKCLIATDIPITLLRQERNGFAALKETVLIRKNYSREWKQ
jgi:hypothetical protein